MRVYLRGEEVTPEMVEEEKYWPFRVLLEQDWAERGDVAILASVLHIKVRVVDGLFGVFTVGDSYHLGEVPTESGLRRRLERMRVDLFWEIHKCYEEPPRSAETSVYL